MSVNAVQVKFEALSYAQFDRTKVRGAMRKGASIIAKASKQAINRRGGGGVVYRRNGRMVAASAPGEPPVRHTSALWRSLKGRASRRGYALIIEALAPHAHLQALGTARMAARALIAPEIERHAETVFGLLRDAIGAGLVTLDGQPGSPPAEVEIN